MQPKEEIEASYVHPDPWMYKSSPADKIRKRYIVEVARLMCLEIADPIRTLDIGAGEGWITEHLPGHVLHAMEISDNAAARIPKNVTRVMEPQGKYNLIVATGVWYAHYDIGLFLRILLEHANGIVLISGIADWIHSSAYQLGTQIMKLEFPYPAGMQRILAIDLRK